MPPSDVESLIRQIHSSGRQFVLCLTGGGSQAIAALLEVPGGSQSVLEAVVPYSPAALDAFLGSRPEKFCDEPTARLMAMKAFERGTKYVTGDPGGVAMTPGGSPGAKTTCTQIAGIGCTASLASDRPKRGAHRVYLAVQTSSFTASVSLELTKGARSRLEEEGLAGLLVLNAAAEACDLPQRFPLNLRPDEKPIHIRTNASAAWQELLFGSQRTICQSGSPAPPRVLFPGSYNPRHEAHREMAQLAAQQLGQPVAHEISVKNVDKPLLDFIEIERRSTGFAASETLWLTRAPTFIEKAELFPGVTFVVGADTILRIAEPKYYQDDVSARDRALERIAALGCRFLVFGRRDAERFQILDDMELPSALKRLCQQVAAERFRRDVSSTELRDFAE